jgi:hypothetical protein
VPKGRGVDYLVGNGARASLKAVKHTSVVPLLFLLFACDPPSDLGNVCELRVADGGLWTSAVSPTDDFIYSGTTQCENLVCLRPAGSPLDAGYGICSNNCTPQDATNPNSLSDDCNGRASGLVCRQLSLDPAFIEALLAQDGGRQLLEEVLGTNCSSASDPGCLPTYCTTPN